MMYTLFVILIVMASSADDSGIVLIQESKGGGLASNFSSSNSIMGVRKTTDFVEKGHMGSRCLAMVVFSVVCAYTAPKAVY
jgi:preprotein translocase subunit SecG